MSDSEEAVKFSLNVVLNKEKTKVLFAEVDSDFADVLLSFLTLPLGTIVRLLDNHYADKAPTIGSLNNLYQSLSNLEISHFWTNISKEILLNARNSFAPLCQKLKLNVDDSEPTKYFCCRARCSNYIVMNRHDLKCKCGHKFDGVVTLESSRIQTASHDDDGVFTKETATFLITDDLVVLPNLAGACIQILDNLGITDANELEETTVSVDFKEIMDLLKASLLSKTPLTDLVVHKSDMVSTNAVISQLQSPLPQIDEVSHTKKMTVKAIVRKSTNKVLLAQADENFIDFLFSLLTIPLGRVIRLLGSNTCLGSVENLYMSITNLDGGMYLKSKELKGLLLNPQLPPEYLSENQIFSHTEILPGYGSTGHFIDLKGKSGYVKGPAIFMVTDDLVVTPSFKVSSITLIKNFGTPISDVEELEIEIGMKEALNILKASLTSTSALTDGLKPVSKTEANINTD